MQQILFEIPLHSWFGIGWDIPIHGYGFMLFVTFIGCTYLATRLAKRQGIPAEMIQDLAIYLFVFGIVGARITFVLRNFHKFTNFFQVFKIWDGGLVFYGSAIGGLVGYIVAYRVLMKKRGVSFWKMADVVAPCVALGLCLGRIGCLLNGCCYGGVVSGDCPAIHFPLPSEPRYVLVGHGFQTAAGFTLESADPASPAKVGKVQPGSPAAVEGLQEGDTIVKVQGKNVETVGKLNEFLGSGGWPRGVNQLELVVLRETAPGQLERVPLPPFTPRTIGIHPTQIYETISTALILFLLLSYIPFRRHNGELLILLMVTYSVHRFINEIIRIDTKEVFAGLTLSQNISILLFVTGIGLGIWLWKQPPQYGPGSEQQGETPSALPKKKQPSEAALKEAPETAIQD